MNEAQAINKSVGLVKEYIKVKRKNSGEITFGGDQNFFASKEKTSIKEAGKAAGKRSAGKVSEDEKKQKMGCGIVALGDIFLYLGEKNKGFLNFHDKHYKKEQMEEGEYCNYYNTIYSFAGGVSLKNGASGIKLWRKFNQMAKLQGWKERAHWGFSKKKIFSRMEEMLEKDIPVILCVPMALFKKDKKEPLKFYQKDVQGNYYHKTGINGHYVVVTALVYEKEETYLVISSWGKQYFIKWKEYEYLMNNRFLGAFLGNLLYIR